MKCQRRKSLPKVTPIFLILTTLLYSLAITPYSSSTAYESSVHLNKQVRSLLDWFHNLGGTINAKLDIRHSDLTQTHVGMFANHPIKANEVLLEIPREAIFSPPPDSKEKQCDVAKKLLHHMENPNTSNFRPYIEYLLTQPHNKLPSVWSLHGFLALRSLLTPNSTSSKNVKNTLPPFYLKQRLKEWTRTCQGAPTPAGIQAYHLLIQRGWDTVLIPVYDMMSHRNGPYLNTMSTSVHQGEDEGPGVKVRASRDIAEGEEIYTSYNFCEDCGARAETYGTPEIFLDYGFVEQYPQRWIFHDKDLAFDLKEKTEGEEELEVVWWQGKPKKEGLYFMREELLRLANVTFNWEGVLPSEKIMIETYHGSLMTAMSHAITSITGEACTSSSCPIPTISFAPLTLELDDFDYNSPLCELHHFIKFDTYELDYEAINTTYNDITFFVDHSNKDMCFDIDLTVQMCTCYRPHYHEIIVHFTARYLPLIKRVLFVGGGDSMLLHEILKYPQLELVVGLELDQTVTRKSFKHFGTQPHWDNEKVQWWYGDATKSLLLLPREYFGSFDMVLVDLSETVMSFKVTDKMDVMEALSVLLKPEGIMVKNEHYLEKMSEIFEYTIQLHYDCPVICHQNVILGSQEVDFFRRDLTYYDVPMLLDKLDRNKYYDIVHSYKHNKTTVDNSCSASVAANDNIKDTADKIQKRSPGILLILEVENIPADISLSLLLSPTLLTEALTKALTSTSLTILSIQSTPERTYHVVVTIILTQGYIVARTFPAHNYVAFDIHLWSAFETHEHVKTEIIRVMDNGTNSVNISAYRIVAGGMFGVKRWEEDEEKRGPNLDVRVCEGGENMVTTPPETNESDNSYEHHDRMLEEIMTLINYKKISVVVFCGDNLPSSTCRSRDVLQKDDNVQHLLPIYTCPNVRNQQPAYMQECEKKTMASMLDFVASSTENRKIHAVVFDPDAPLPMGQIWDSVFTILYDQEASQTANFADNLLITAAIMNEGDDWKRQLLHRCFKVIRYEPVFRTEMTSPGGKMTGAIVSAGDGLFFERLNNVTSQLNIEEREGEIWDVPLIRGGLWKIIENYKPDQFFLSKDYDQWTPLQQYMSQQPLGLQSLFQLEVKSKESDEEERDEQIDVNKWKQENSKDKIDDIHLTLASIKQALNKTITKRLPQSSFFDVKHFQYIGGSDGCLFSAHWYEGNFLILWDGRNHVDINFFTYAEDNAMGEKFQSTFRSVLSSLKTKRKAVKNNRNGGDEGGVLHPVRLEVVSADKQPRGYGRVVNFRSDFKGGKEPRAVPLWAE